MKNFIKSHEERIEKLRRDINKLQGNDIYCFKDGIVSKVESVPKEYLHRFLSEELLVNHYFEQVTSILNNFISNDDNKEVNNFTYYVDEYSVNIIYIGNENDRNKYGRYDLSSYKNKFIMVNHPLEDELVAIRQEYSLYSEENKTYNFYLEEPIYIQSSFLIKALPHILLGYYKVVNKIISLSSPLLEQLHSSNIFQKGFCEQELGLMHIGNIIAGYYLVEDINVKSFVYEDLSKEQIINYLSKSLDEADKLMNLSTSIKLII